MFSGCFQGSVATNVDAETGETFHTPVLEHAHIRSKKPNGPRYDPKYPKDKLDSFDNLILLCPNHHGPVVDAELGRAFKPEDLEKMREDHIKNFDRLEALEGTLNAYLGVQFGADNTILFEQAQLRGPTVEAMFVDVPFTCRSDAQVAEVLASIAAKHPGDFEASSRTDGQPVTGAAQALLSPEWKGNALLVGGPGQGKSTLLQYVCQFHRSRLLNKTGYAGDGDHLDVSEAQPRFPIRIDLRKYAEWARTDAARRGGRRPNQAGRGRGRQNRRRAAATPEVQWRTIEEYLAHDITTRAASGSTFRVEEVATMVSTRSVLIALDGLDEIADLKERERVSEYAVKLNSRLQGIAHDLVVLVATRPGGTTPQLWSSAEFPRMDLLPLSQGLRLQYLHRWCKVAGFDGEKTDEMQREFMKSAALPHIRDLAAYPMQLAILLHMLYKQQIMPEKRTKLYDQYFDAFLTREQAHDKEPLLATERPLVERVHAYLGWYIQTETEAGRCDGAITGVTLQRELRRFLADRDGGKRLADKLFDAFTTRMLCLNAKEHDAYQFEVQTLREYFTAVHIFEQADMSLRDDILTAMLRRPYWSNVLRFFVGRYTDGEVRGLKNLFQESAEDGPLNSMPLVRATAAQLLNDRVYQGQKARPFVEIVDFILEGPGVVLAEDGLLDSGGGPLVFSDQAGRAQAVEHLKTRLEESQTREMTRVLCSNLSRHAEADDDLDKWAKKAFQDDVTWLYAAAPLGILTSGLPGQDARLARAMASFRSDSCWASDLLAGSKYVGKDDAVVTAIVNDFNDGAYELISKGPLQASTPGLIAALVLRALGRGTGEGGGQESGRLRVRSRPGSASYGSLAAATAKLPARPKDGTAKDWAQIFDSVADVWGDGWVLTRAIGLAPNDVDLSLVAAINKHPAAAAVARRLHAMYAHRSDPAWWSTQLTTEGTPRDHASTVIGLIANAHVAVFTENAVALNALLDSLPPKYFASVHASLMADSKRLSARQLFIGDAVRRAPTKFGPRALWLFRYAAADSGREHITAALSREPNATVAGIGGVDLRGPVTLVAHDKKLKLATLHNKRSDLPTGGWASDIELVTLRKADVHTVLDAPIEWPADIVYLASQKAAAELESKNKHLNQLALDEEWFPAGD
jgi:hypothetical protein